MQVLGRLRLKKHNRVIIEKTKCNLLCYTSLLKRFSIVRGVVCDLAVQSHFYCMDRIAIRAGYQQIIQRPPTLRCVHAR